MLQYNFNYMYDNDSTEKLKKMAAYDYYYDKRPQILEVPNGIILPSNRLDRDAPFFGKGGVVTADGSFMKQSTLSTNLSGTLTFGGKYEYNEDELTIYDEPVIYMGPFVNHWGHLLADLLSRLWCLELFPKNYKIAFCGVWDWEVHAEGQSKELLELIWGGGYINVKRPSKFKKVYLPEESLEWGTHYSEEYKRIYKRIVEKAKLDIPCYEKIYFTRSKLRNKKEFGEKGIEYFFSANGYKVFSPENMSAREQITLINQCKKFASIEGTIAHGIVFASDNEQEVEQIIIKKKKENNPRQPLFNSMIGASVVYIDAYVQPYNMLPEIGQGPYLLKVNANLKNYARENGMIAPHIKYTVFLSDFVQYSYIYFRECIKRLQIKGRIRRKLSKIKILKVMYIKIKLIKSLRACGK